MSDFGLDRFIPKHREHFAEAIRELKAGQKIGCWSWYLLPTPFKENASEENKRFALRSDDEARAYLKFSERGVDLGQNYLTIMTVIADQLEAGISPQRLLGIDVPRLAASAAFFERVAQDDEGLSLEVARVRKALRQDDQKGLSRLWQPPQKANTPKNAGPWLINQSSNQTPKHAGNTPKNAGPSPKNAGPSPKNAGPSPKNAGPSPKNAAPSSIKADSPKKAA